MASSSSGTTVTVRAEQTTSMAARATITLYGGAGNDNLSGGSGSDTLDGGSATTY
jgi:Ca2+-binding RTX toxin-like protein